MGYDANGAGAVMATFDLAVAARDAASPPENDN